MRKFLVCLTCLLLAAPALAAPADDEIRAQIVGGWISAPVTYRDPDNMLQVFRDDGTSTAYFFKDESCTTLLARIDVKWEVSGGVLTLSYAEGHKDRDEVTLIDAQKLSMRSLDIDGQMMERVRATNCKEPAR